MVDERGDRHRFEKLLLATGGAPRKLAIPGGDLEGVCYFRTLDDYLAPACGAGRGKSAVVIGGGFIGSEMAAALAHVRCAVTMVFPERVPGAAGVPRAAGALPPGAVPRARHPDARRRRPHLHRGEGLAPGHPDPRRRAARRRTSSSPASGCRPSIELAREAGLQVGDGIVVNASSRPRARTSTPPATTRTSPTSRSGSGCGSSTGTTR